MLKKIKDFFKSEKYVEGLDLTPYKNTKNLLSGYCPWSCMVAEGVVLLKSGAIMRSFIFSCPDLGSSSAESINSVSWNFNNALKSLGTGWAVQFEVQRYKTKEYPGAIFDNEAAYIVDKCREANFKNYGEHFASSYYMTFTKELPSELKQKSSSFFFKRDGEDKENINTGAIRKEIDNFITVTTKIIGSLSSSLKVKPLNSAETVSYLHTSVSLKWYGMNFPNHFIFIDKMITDEDIENSIPLKLGKNYIPIITVKDFPMETYPAIFDSLNAAEIEYRWSTRFISLDKSDAQKYIEKTVKRFYGSRKSAKQLLMEETMQVQSNLENQGAAAFQQDAQNAQEESLTDIFGFGFYASSLMVWDQDVDAAMDKARYLESIISSCGFASKIETQNSLKAYLSMQPGNLAANTRTFFVSTGNVSHIIPLSSIWEGMINNNHTKEVTGVNVPLLTCSTRYGTPFFLNLNVNDVGHVIILGPTGAGKSTLMNLLEIQMLKYLKSNVIIFDVDKSARGLTMAAGGIYVEPGGENNIAFQPLAELETNIDILWAAEFIECLLTVQNITVTPEMKLSINEALKLMKSLNIHERTLTSFNQYVNYVNPETGTNDIRVGISPYVLGGQYGNIFDADSTSMPLSKWTMIEMGSLMKLNDQAITPALMFLFKYVEKVWEGKKDEITLLVMDEFHVFLKNPIFVNQIGNWLMRLRKKNVWCLFATQNIASARKTEIAEILIQQCLTKIYLADETALTAGQKDGYRYFGLSDPEIAAIRHARMKHDYFYKSPLGARMFQLDLDKTQLSILTSDHEFLDLLEQKYGKNCGKPLVKEILEHNNINYEKFINKHL